MCLSLCHVHGRLYFNHDEGECGRCPSNRPDGRRCGDCRHCRGQTCNLASAPLPRRGWCCHWNARPLEGELRINVEQVERGLRRVFRDDLAELLETYSIDATPEGEGEGFRLAVAGLAVPLVYGVPCEDWEAALGLDGAPGEDCEAAGADPRRSERCAW